MWQAASVSAWLHDLLAEDAAGLVHSVFDRATNLLLDGCLVTVQDRRLGNAPQALLVDPPLGGFLGAGWRPGAPAAVRGGFLWVGEDAICLDAPRWEPVPRRPPTLPGAAALRANAARLGAVLAREGRTQGMLGPTLAGSGLVTPLLRGEMQAAPRLVGLGPGLTPAGDDLLGGLLATLTVAGDPRAAALARAVLPLRHRTTTVAAAMLTAAARGGLPERVGNLLEDLLSLSGDAAVSRAGPALTLGHSSGTDLCCGIYVGLMLLSHRVET